MLKKELNRLEVSLDTPYKQQVIALEKGQYVLRLIHQNDAVFKRLRSLFFSFAIDGKSPEEVKGILGLRDISDQFGAFAYVGAGSEESGYFVKELILNVMQEVAVLNIDLRTFLPTENIFIEAFQVFNAEIPLEEIYGEGTNGLFFKAEETIDFSPKVEETISVIETSKDYSGISLKEIDKISLKSFSVNPDTPKEIILNDLEAGNYVLKIIHQSQAIFEKYKSLFFTFSLPDVDNDNKVKDILGLSSISSQHGVFSYAGGGVLKDGKYYQDILLEITQNINELVIELHTFFDANILIEGCIFEKNHIVSTVTAPLETKTSKNKVESLLTKDWILENLILNKQPKTSFRVACILDDFTYNSYKYECDLQQLTRDHWQADLERIQPQLLFVESAWRGKDEQWYNVINKNIDELQGIVKWCKERDIPTVFWNKEDPIHFQTFINTAQQFDHVFTTDLDCLSKYKETLGHENVGFLPFACQPVVNNPIELYKREDTFCFAGAYYAKYPERTEDLGNIVRALGDYKGVDIYDRNFYKTDPDYMFPAEYQPYIVGTLPFEEIDKAYKGYKYSINLNSIKQSQTMFARRVYELLASNTLTISNFSRGIRTLFGDLVFVSDSGKELVKRLENLLDDDLEYGKFRLLGLRKVMLEHTYERRFNYILNQALPAGKESDYLPEIDVIAVVHNAVEMKKIIEQFDGQEYSNKNLIIIDANTNLTKLAQFGVTTYKLSDIRDKEVLAITNSQYLSFFDTKDYYGPNYLLDLALATKYSQAEVVGKSFYFEKKDDGVFINKGEAYSPAGTLFARASLVLKDVIHNMPIKEYIADTSFEFEKMLSIDPYNYCKNGGELLFDEQLEVNDLSLNEGYSLTELIAKENKAYLLANTKITNANQQETKSSLDKSLHFYPEELNRLFGSQKKALIEYENINNTFVLRSQMDANQHDYLYSPELIEIKSIVLEAQNFYLKCSGEKNLDIQIAVLFYDKDKKRLGHLIKDINQLISIEKDEAIKYVQVGWRIKGKGQAVITKLSFYPPGLKAVKQSRIVNDILMPDKIHDIFKNEGSKFVQLTYSENEGYIIQSSLADEKHEYIYAKNTLNLLDITTENEIPLYLDAGAGVDIQIVCFFLNDKKQRIGHQIEYPRMNAVIKPITGTVYLLFGWRIRGGGSTVIKGIHFKPQNFNPNIVFGQSDVLVLTNNYPSYNDLYKNAFVHSRVQAYKNEGLKVDVFQFTSRDIALSYREFEDVDVIQGSSKLLDIMLKSKRHKKVLVHFLDENMWEILQKYIDDIEVIVWVHGADIQPWWRRKFNYEGKSDTEMESIKLASAQKEAFWKNLLDEPHANLSFVFVSQQFADEIMGDYNSLLPKEKYHIIHNYIDSNAFKYEEKHPDMRKNILSIRPFASKTYANDLTVKAILELSKEPWFHELNFTIIGDGILFDELTEPIKNFSNVRLEKRFLNQQEIIEEHKKHGVFLVPTRMDTQGVSRGEAMSSGLVAVTNNVAAIPEFCSDEDSMLAESEDYVGLCCNIHNLFKDAFLYKYLSVNASKRVQQQCGFIETIAREVTVIKGVICLS